MITLRPRPEYKTSWNQGGRARPMRPCAICRCQAKFELVSADGVVLGNYCKACGAHALSQARG